MKRYLLLCLFFLCKLDASPFIEAAATALETTVLIEADNQKGCGFLLKDGNRVMTLFHIVKDAKEITVRLPSGEWIESAIFFGDLENDVAVLEVGSSEFKGLDLDFSFQIGEWVLSAGIPFASQVTVKKGIVANLEQKLGKDFLLVDFPFNPGDLGGPLLNLEGKVIGMQFANTTTHDVFGVIIPSQTLLEVALKWGVFL